MLTFLIQQVIFTNLDVLGFIVLTFAFEIGAVLFLRTKFKDKLQLRKIPIMDSIDEGIRYAAETGRPILLSGGSTYYVYAAYQPATNELVKYISKMAAELNVRFLTTVGSPVVHLMFCDYSRQGAMEAGYPERYNINDHYYVSGSPAQQVLDTGLVTGQNVGLEIPWTGHAAGSQLVAMEAAQRIDAMRIGTEVWACDVAITAINAQYICVAEEAIIVGALVVNDPFQIATIVGEDFVKWFIMAALIAIPILRLVGLM